jgi:hypothetical protein
MYSGTFNQEKDGLSKMTNKFLLEESTKQWSHGKFHNENISPQCQHDGSGGC